MERRNFFKLAAGATLAPSLLAAAQRTSTPDEVAAVKAKLVEWYRAFANPRVDRDYYRTFMTDDYLLLENGELLDVAGDVALLDGLAPDHVRTDTFDFRHVRVDDDHANAVYFLEASMNDSKQGPRHRRWLESAVLRKVGGQWRVAILHSTRINPPNL